MARNIEFKWPLGDDLNPNTKALFEWHNTHDGDSPLQNSPIQAIQKLVNEGKAIETVISDYGNGVMMVGYSDMQNRYIMHTYI